jgi:hypothetical protein
LRLVPERPMSKSRNEVSTVPLFQRPSRLMSIRHRSCRAANLRAGSVKTQEATKLGTSAPCSARAVPLDVWMSRLPTVQCLAYLLHWMTILRPSGR